MVRVQQGSHSDRNGWRVRVDVSKDVSLRDPRLAGGREGRICRAGQRRLELNDERHWRPREDGERNADVRCDLPLGEHREGDAKGPNGRHLQIRVSRDTLRSGQVVVSKQAALGPDKDTPVAFVPPLQLCNDLLVRLRPRTLGKLHLLIQHMKDRLFGQRKPDDGLLCEPVDFHQRERGAREPTASKPNVAVALIRPEGVVAEGV
mmetsp:Transcript_15129/g.35844  ORF Transcript_15129/g.35844 Transcript_15129/m.35844 type:complete len:205 (-) Transcript_15129:642-1256(-)